MTNNKSKRPGFMLYFTAGALFLGLDDDKAGKLIKACFYYASTGQYPNDILILKNENGTCSQDELLEYAFGIIQDLLDRDERKYNDTCEKRSAAGIEGAKAKSRASKKKIDDDWT